MKIGLMAPQGWKGEYTAWDPAAAWGRTLRLAVEAEQLGFESLWVFDHFQTVPRPTDEITFEAFGVITALAVATRDVRLGQMVACTGFRNPALTAKMASTIDVISGGRFELGLGAGWKEDEWRAYGYGFPSLRARMAVLGDHLQVVKRMLEPGRATYDGAYAHVRGAINVPKGLQKPHLPIIVGGNGENVTWRLAARFADELNLVYLSPQEVAEVLPIIERRCEEEGRDRRSLRLSVYAPDEEVVREGQARIDLLAGYAALGVERLVGFLPTAIRDPEAQERLALDARAAGVEMSERDSHTPPAVYDEAVDAANAPSHR